MDDTILFMLYIIAFWPVITLTICIQCCFIDAGEFSYMEINVGVNSNHPVILSIFCTNYLTPAPAPNFRKLHFNDRKSILCQDVNKSKCKDQPQVTFSTKYHPCAKRITKCLYKHCYLIENDSHLRHLFPAKIMTCYKKVKNIGDIVVRNKSL